ELGLLGGLGLAPVVDRCLVCGAADARAYRWDPDRGGAVCAGCARGGRPLSAEARAALVRLAGVPLGEAGRERLPPDVNRDCREALLEIINHHVSGPLKSVEFIAKLSAGVGGVA
ncbi:MAG TPA: DNA repair protein RecO C-terminal domain-containing protein, partial [Polyangia bacterium]|nr:DNA repair protein RecO C-terminal domain-containing protein [Polyangia bacterium]